jgi:hypothetical protein
MIVFMSDRKVYVQFLNSKLDLIHLIIRYKKSESLPKMTSILVIFSSDEFVTSYLEMSSHP